MRTNYRAVATTSYYSDDNRQDTSQFRYYRSSFLCDLKPPISELDGQES